MIVVNIKILIRRILISIKTEIKCVAVDWLQFAQNWSCCVHTLKNMLYDLGYEEILHPLCNSQFRNRKTFFAVRFVDYIPHKFPGGD